MVTEFTEESDCYISAEQSDTDTVSLCEQIKSL